MIAEAGVLEQWLLLELCIWVLYFIFNGWWCDKMGFVFGVLRFFRLPLQVALGLYFAFMMLIVTAAGIAYFAEGIDYCNEFKFAVGAGQVLPNLWKL